MASETERVEYVFEGDIKSLRTATQTAMNLLNKYSDTMRRTSSTEGFRASKKSTQSMNASINKLTKDVDKMQAKLKSVGDVKLPSGSSAAKAMGSMLSTLNSQMVKLGSTNPVTTRTLNEFKTQLDGVRSSLQSASPQVERLISSEQRHQATMEAVKGAAARLREGMDTMKTRLSGVFDPVNSKLRTFSSAFNPITSKIQSFKDVAGTALSRVGQLANTLASAFRRVTQEENNTDAATRRSSESHRSLGNLFRNVSSGIKEETSAIREEKQELSGKESTLKKSKGSHRSLLQTITGLGRQVKTEARSFSLFGGSLVSLNSVTNALSNALSTLTGVQLSDWLGKATSSAINYIENLNLFTVAMGSSAQKGLEFVSTMQEVYGMDPSNLYRYAGYFYQLADAIGATSTASAAMSLSLTKAANDIASLFNVEIEQVVNNLASGMQGMTRAVRKYGMDIRMVTLQQTALKYGLTEQVETMSEANRQALRFITMMEQASNAIHQYNLDSENASEELGDFARNIETPANQLRIFKEQMSQLGRAIGNFIVAPLSKAIAYVNGFIMALRMMLNFVASTFGLLNESMNKVDTSGADEAADAVNSIGTAAGSAAEKLKDLNAPFDELNVLQEQSASGGGSGGINSDDVLDPALEQALVDMELKLENIRMRANEVRDSILKFLGFKVDEKEHKIVSWSSEDFENNVINKFPGWTKTIQRAFTIWGKLSKSLKPIFDLIGGAIRKVAEDLVYLFGLLVNDETVSGLIDIFTEVVASLSSTVKTVLTPVINTLLKVWSYAVEILIGAFNLLSDTWKETLEPLVTALLVAVGKIGSEFSKLWEEYIGPVVENIAKSIPDLLSNIWKNTLEPILKAIIKAVEAVASVFEALWQEFIGPIVKYIALDVSELWTETLKPIIEKVIDIIGGVIEIILALWTNILAPIVKYLIKVLGPAFKSVFILIWDIVQRTIDDIGDILEGLLTILDGVIDFIAGVFTGDWKRAWKGLVNIFVGIGNSIISVFETVLNAIRGLINTFISSVYTGAVGLINSIGGAVETVAEVVFKKKVNLRITSPPFKIPEITIPRIPEMARGGVVTSPTYLLAGEGRYNEAILPLDNSPQMEQLVQRIADAVDRDDKSGNGSGSSPVEVRVYIGGKEYDAFTYKAAKRGERIVGAQPVMERG